MAPAGRPRGKKIKPSVRTRLVGRHADVHARPARDQRGNPAVNVHARHPRRVAPIADPPTSPAPSPPRPPHQSRRPRRACTQAVSRACPGVPPATSPPPHRCRLPPLSAPRLPRDRCRLPLRLPDATAAACRRCRLLACRTPPLPPPRLPADRPAAWFAPPPGMPPPDASFAAAEGQSACTPAARSLTRRR
nr:WAS/WASL-interacting protein family member 3-like [Aegilops tauschii subsp. strangulata]XP_040253662.1 WAS/WASL-interacting protein family member 3-like [Aegilops tauschii subsp. strangulata]